MNRLLQLFSRSGASFLFVVLEVCCFYLIVNFNSQQQEIAFATWSLYSSQLMEEYSELREYVGLREKMDQMQAENARLLAQLRNAKYTEEVVIDSVRQDSLRQRYTYIAADIVNKSPLGANITYVLNRGRIHGVEKHQGVISDRGVVGIVVNVSPRHARVMSLLHREFRLSAGLRGKPYFGSLQWDGGDARYATLYALPEYAQFARGDTIETTGYSNIFPTGLAIGTVAEYTPVQGGTTFVTTVRLLADFYELQHVYVVRDLLKDDLEQLTTEEE